MGKPKKKTHRSKPHGQWPRKLWELYEEWLDVQIDKIFVTAKDLGYSHQELARRAGLSPTTISNIFYRLSNPLASTVWKMGKAVGLAMEFELTFDRRRPSKPRLAKVG